MRVVLINNYDLLGILEALKQEKGNAPAQHLWGYLPLNDRRITVDILPFEKYSYLKKISKKLKILGDLDQQLRLLAQQQRYDVIYSAHHLTTLLLSFLRLVGFLSKPIVAIAYQAPQEKTFFWKLFTKIFVMGNDKILCLSEALRRDFEEFGIPKQKLELIEWGTDLKFYQFGSSRINQSLDRDNKRFILSPGKTYRDYPTLLEAFKTIDCKLVICGAGATNLNTSVDDLSANVALIPEMIYWKKFIKLYQRAYAVAIPLDNNDNKFKNAIGLTALTEAMATGNAIVMTRNEYVGVDLEKEGIGLWVEPGDVDGWRHALSYLLDHPEVAQEMGHRSRLLAEKRFNLETFSSKLANYLRQTCHCGSLPIENTSIEY
jgi:glycosyltransferase involved in cell wall biosynthesis